MILKNKLSNKILLVIFLFIFIACSKNNKTAVATKKQNLELVQKEKEIDSLIQVDFIDKKYKYLDKNFNIIIDSLSFNQINSKKLRGRRYKDSLFIILKYELKNDMAVNIAFHKIVYTWKRLGFYIWEDEIDAQKIAHEFGFNHPYRFIKFLRDSTIYNDKKKIFLENLKNKIEKKTEKKIISSNSPEFLDIAFKINPKRIDEVKKYKIENHNH